MRLLVVGGPEAVSAGDQEMDRLRSLADELGIAKNVVFTGPQPHRRLPTFYRAVDAVVVVSHSESFGLVALEAAACGTPVVGTSVGGLSHIVTDGISGLSARQRNPSQLCRTIEVSVARSVVASAPFDRSRTSRDAYSVGTEQLMNCLRCMSA